MTPTKFKTPYFLIDERRLIANLEKAKRLREISGAKVLLALKCFSTWGVFDLMRPYLDGTTSSGPYEACLGHETFGGETHAYSVGFSADDVRAVASICDKIIFNSQSQLAAYRDLVGSDTSIGLRLNPGISYAAQDLADPARPHSRLGVHPDVLQPGTLDTVDGVMFHMNCENADLDALLDQIRAVSERFGSHIDRLDWISLGGGISFTHPGYDLDALGRAIRAFAERHGVQVYLEPGEAIISRTTDLVVTVVDLVQNTRKTAIVDSATEAHRLDTLIYDEPATIREASANGPHEYVIGSCSCLAGDQFCVARFDTPIEVGQRLHVEDSAGYTMVKLNWFNGLRMPSVYCRRADGRIDKLNEFDYSDFKRSLTRWPITHRVAAGAREIEELA